MPDQLNLDAIKARLAAATPGPWEWRTVIPPVGTGADARRVLVTASLDLPTGLGWKSWRDTERTEMPVLEWPAIRDEVVLDSTCTDSLYEVEGSDIVVSDPNADLVANAPADLAALVAEVEQLRARVAELEAR